MGLAGALGFDPAHGNLERALAVLADGRTRPLVWRDAPIELGACVPASVAWPTESPIAVVFDGALHNQDVVREALGATDERRDPAELIRRGYARWGIETLLDRLVGDFAFALWDGDRRRLILARDALGMRPLFYWQNGDRILFASSTRALHAVPEVPREIDPEQAVRPLLFWRQDQARTAFRHIDKVIAGHAVLFERGLLRSLRWWRPEEREPLRLADDAAYAEIVRETLDQAIAARLPANQPVAVSLSGGLDSTAVAALAARRLATQNRRLWAFTRVPASDDTIAFANQTANEGPMAAQLARAYANIDHVLLPHDLERDLFDVTDARNRYSDVPGTTPYLFGNLDRMWGAMAARGCVTVLGGDLGELTFSYKAEDYPSALLRSGDVAGWLRLALGLHAAGHGWKAILYNSLGPALPPAARRNFARLIGKRVLSVAASAPLNRDLARRMGVKDHLVQHAFDRTLDKRLTVLRRVDFGPVAEYVQRRHGMAYTLPALDRRLVELCLAIPERQFILNGQNRSLARRMMRGLVPNSILDATGRGRGSSDRHVAMTRARPRILEELARMERSALASACVDLPRLRQLAENWPRDGWDRPEIEAAYGFYLANGLALGHFLRRFEGGNS